MSAESPSGHVRLRSDQSHLEGYQDDVDFVYVSKETLAMLAAGTGPIILSGCRIRFKRAWAKNIERTRRTFSLKIEGNRAPKFKSTEPLAHDIVAGFPCPPVWIKK